MFVSNVHTTPEYYITGYINNLNRCERLTKDYEATSVVFNFYGGPKAGQLSYVNMMSYHSPVSRWHHTTYTPRYSLSTEAAQDSAIPETFVYKSWWVLSLPLLNADRQVLTTLNIKHSSSAS